MIRNSLKGNKNNQPDNSFKSIESNGFDAERLGAANLTIALNSRVSWASRKEDNSKVDLITTFQHPWKKNQVEVILTQIKSGSSFGNVDQNETGLKIKFQKNKFSDYTKRNHSTLICWLNREENQFYWFIIKANAEYFRSEFNSTHLLNPCTRFDIERILNSFNSKNGGKGLIFTTIRKPPGRKDKYPYEEFKELRKEAKAIYKKYSEVEVTSPLFGTIEFTRIGWRHISRESRLDEYKVATYEIIRILDHILNLTPSKHFISEVLNEKDNKYSYRHCEYILEYDGIKVLEKPTNHKFSTKVFVKLVEVIKYPNDWKNNSYLSQLMERRVIFKSIYYKRK